jgi:hypothetical protein
MLIMACDNCAVGRNLAKGEPRWCNPVTGEGRAEPVDCESEDMVEGATVGCFPDLYGALAGNMPDQVISL